MPREINSSAGAGDDKLLALEGARARTRRPRRSPYTAELSLRELQEWFQGEIMRPHERPRRGRPARVQPPARVVEPSATLSAEERVSIYSRMYFARLVDCLSEDYPTVFHVQGAHEFARLTRAYLTRFPPEHYSLNKLGARFPEFLESKVRVRQKLLTYDIARLERMMTDVFDAEESPVLSPDACAALAPERWAEVRLRPIAAFGLLTFHHDSVNAVVTAVRKEETIPAVRRRTSWTVVWRRTYRVFRRDLPEPWFELLSALSQGATILAAIERAAERFDGDDAELERRVFSWFQESVAEGFFTAVE